MNDRAGRARMIAALLVAFILFTAAAPSVPEVPIRVALVIGNSDYTTFPVLTHPKDDASLLAATLRDVGFKIVGGSAQVNVSKEKLESLVEEFVRASNGAEVSFFYYAGHGVQDRGKNWLIPTTANFKTRENLETQSYDVDKVLQGMASAKTRLNIVALDACRDTPFRGLKRSVITEIEADGLAKITATDDRTIVSFATAPNKEASDGPGAHSPYASALAKHLKQPGLEIKELFNQVGVDVENVTTPKQVPWLNISPIKGKFYLAGGAESPPVGEPARPASDRLAVVASLGEGAVASDLSRFESQLVGSIVAGRRYTLVDRAKLSSVLQEQRFSHRSIVDPKTAAQLGKIVGASQILFANLAVDVQVQPGVLLTQIAATSSSDYRLLDVSTATVIKSGSSDGSGNEKAAAGGDVTPLQKKKARTAALDSCAQTLADQLGQ